MTLLALIPVLGAPGPANAARPNGDSRSDSHHDTSPPLRAMKAKHDSAEESLRKLSHHDENDGAMPQRGKATAKTAAVQSSAPTAKSAAPVAGQSFDGVGAGFTGPQGTYTVNSAPPDTNSAVGPNQVVEIVNSAFAVFDKTGRVLYGPANNNTLWSGFGGSCQSTNDGDGVVRYDRIAGRWVITQFANAASATGPYYECVAVSQTGDATGAWYRYSYQFSSFPDYPKLSIWPDAYYITYNLFNGNTFAGAEACAMDRTQMLLGAAASQQCFTTGSSYGGLLASDLDSSTLPPAGAPNVMLALGTTSTSLATWSMHPDFVTPANATFTGPSSIAVAAYSQACNGGTCVPQLSTTNQLDSLADRLMFRLGYRNFSDHQSWVVSHSVTVNGAAAVRWYELRPSGSTVSVYQQGTYAPNSTYRWMPSVAMDKAGDIGVGYSSSSGTQHPALAYSGRLAADPLGTLTQGDNVLLTGGGSQTGSLHRWGDYSSLSIDPTDDCTFWFSSEYIPGDGSFNWHTRIGSFSFPSCSGPATNDFSIASSPSSGTVTQGSSTTATVSTAVVSGAAETVTLSTSGLPAGAAASFSPTTVTAGGSSTLTISTTSATPAGSYAVSVTGTAASATHTTSYNLTVQAPVTAGVSNGGFETGTLSGWTPAGTTSVPATGAHSGSYSAQLGTTTQTNGDSSAAQTFAVPSGQDTMSFWYSVTCPDTVSYDWVTATLTDNTTATTGTVLAKTCTNGAGWKQVTSKVTAGHPYTLTLVSHDDNYAGDATYARYDDVVLSAAPHTVTVTNPGAQTTTVGTAVSKQITATDSAAGETLTYSATGLPTGLSINGSSGLISGTPTVTGTSTVSVTATDSTSASGSTTFTWTVNPVGGIANGDFETGSLSGWTATGTTSVVGSGAHGGTYAGQGGSTAATNGDSSLAQTFTAPTGTTSLSFWYSVTCPDTVTYDWATATLKDNTTGTTSTVLAKTCANGAGWKQVTSAVTAGHSYTLTLVSHDDNYAGDATFTRWDDARLT